MTRTRRFIRASLLIALLGLVVGLTGCDRHRVRYRRDDHYRDHRGDRHAGYVVPPPPAYGGPRAPRGGYLPPPPPRPVRAAWESRDDYEDRVEDWEDDYDDWKDDVEDYYDDDD